MLNINENDVVRKVLNDISICYNFEQEKLRLIGINHNTEGEIRYAAGNLVEIILQTIFNTINSFLDNNKIISKVGTTDYLKKRIEYKGKMYENNSIQVDRHIWYAGKRIAFIENKTYLDSCYYDRALADFKKISQALIQQGDDPKKCEFIVFAGQKAAKDNTLLTYEAEFWYETKNLLATEEGIVPKIFFFLKGIRSSSKPLYKIKHELDKKTIEDFVRLFISILRNSSN